MSGDFSSHKVFIELKRKLEIPVGIYSLDLLTTARVIKQANIPAGVDVTPNTNVATGVCSAKTD